MSLVVGPKYQSQSNSLSSILNIASRYLGAVLYITQSFFIFVINNYECLFEIKDNPLTNYSFLCEEYCDKIMGIQIEYSGLVYLKKMSLNKWE